MVLASCTAIFNTQILTIMNRHHKSNIRVCSIKVHDTQVVGYVVRKLLWNLQKEKHGSWVRDCDYIINMHQWRTLEEILFKQTPNEYNIWMQKMHISTSRCNDPRWSKTYLCKIHKLPQQILMIGLQTKCKSLQAL